MNMDDSIRMYALQNAVQFKGKCNPGALVGKIVGEFPDAKDNMQETMQAINRVAREVNSLSLEEQKQAILDLDPEYFESKKEAKEKRKEERKELPELKNAEVGKVITRIAPEPSKYNHIGHAMSFLINYMYAKKYDGKCILRFDDTNPEKESQEYVDAMREDVIDYLGIEVDKVVFASDYNDHLIKKAEELIEKGQAYTCSCKKEKMSLGRREMKECSHRSKDVEIVKKEWDEMKSGLHENMVLRLKIDMEHKNAVMRDPVIFRIVNYPHYRHEEKYKAWPMYDFECAVLEGELGITHVNRSNEFHSRIELQKYIRDLFNLGHVEVRQYARVSVEGAITQGREIRGLVESGEYIGWDDPRLVTLKALKRRGIVRDAYYELAKVIGMSKSNSVLDFSVISSINRRLLDKSAKRFFMIENPREITIKNAPEQEIELDLHPEVMEGGRKFKTNDSFYIEKKDFDDMKNMENIRLMDCLNFIHKENGELEFTNLSYNDFRTEGKKLIHWLPLEDNVDVEILMDDNKTKSGFAEKNIEQLEIGDVIQFERFGFCRLDSIEGGVYKFWFTHK
ncbi:glutamate--tRNA ligase [Candidatus Woesearchaeota archaeon]|nr:glutamate--tRNA ligase [Candidatus Woesearchaeota archaeon]